MDTDTYKKELEQLKVIITTDLESIAVHRQDIDDWEIVTEPVEHDMADPNDHADIAEDSEERLATFHELIQRYQNIVRALKKIDEGTYGVCEISGEPIETERLTANPAARTCIKHRDNEADLLQ